MSDVLLLSFELFTEKRKGLFTVCLNITKRMYIMLCAVRHYIPIHFNGYVIVSLCPLSQRSTLR